MDTKKIDIQKLLAPAALVILYIFFCFAGKNFFSASTLVSILDSTYYVGLMAFGITFVIITSGIDLSIGTNMMMSALLAGYMNAKGANIWICLIAAVAIATFVGFLNGTLISRLKLPPFIATLGVMMMTQGFGSIITKVQTQRFPGAGAPGSEYKYIFYKTASGFPSGIVYMLVFFVVALFLLNKTRFGFHCLCRNLYYHYSRYRQRFGNECHCCCCYWRYFYGWRCRHDVRYFNWRPVNERPENRLDVYGLAGPFSDFLYWRCRYPSCIIGYLPQ